MLSFKYRNEVEIKKQPSEPEKLKTVVRKIIERRNLSVLYSSRTVTFFQILNLRKKEHNMKIFEIKINNETTYTVDTDKYTELWNMLDKINDDYTEIRIEIISSYEYVPQQFSHYFKDLCNGQNLLDFLDKYINLEEDLEEYYNDLENQDEIPYLYELMDFSDPEEFFNTYFSNPYEAARATQFGKVNWFDDYIKFDGYGNLKSVPSINFDDYAGDIMEQWLKENF